MSECLEQLQSNALPSELSPDLNQKATEVWFEHTRHKAKWFLIILVNHFDIQPGIVVEVWEKDIVMMLRWDRWGAGVVGKQGEGK
jgi:hypothetical protein